MTANISNISDIKLLVNSFYNKVKEDELLAEIFESKLHNNWPQHLEKMYRFWQTVLLEEQTYSGSPFAPHAKLNINKEHFERWMELFNNTVDEHFSGEKAEEAKWRAGKMAELFHNKIEYIKTNLNKHIL